MEVAAVHERIAIIWKEKLAPLVIIVKCHWRNELHDWRPLKAGHPFHGEGQPDQWSSEFVISRATMRECPEITCFGCGVEEICMALLSVSLGTGETEWGSE